MIKFIAGPFIGVLGKDELPFWATICLTVLGMMTSVLIISIIGENIRKWVIKKIYKNSKPGQSKNRRINKILKAHGLKGVAFLTPLLLTPILGTILALSLGELRKKIFVYMLISAVCWSIVLTFLAYKFKELFIYLKDLIDFPV
ncbi:MAG: hypothetical protein IIA88_09545 [Bacteroidetes bacterium]|nr:hypothetical protein [Bacteroidota bacterium]